MNCPSDVVPASSTLFIPSPKGATSALAVDEEAAAGASAPACAFPSSERVLRASHNFELTICRMQVTTRLQPLIIGVEESIQSMIDFVGTKENKTEPSQTITTCG
jgi:hypothetical protein